MKVLTIHTDDGRELYMIVPRSESDNDAWIFSGGLCDGARIRGRIVSSIAETDMLSFIIDVHVYGSNHAEFDVEWIPEAEWKRRGYPIPDQTVTISANMNWTSLMSRMMSDVRSFIRDNTDVECYNIYRAFVQGTSWESEPDVLYMVIDAVGDDGIPMSCREWIRGYNVMAMRTIASVMENVTLDPTPMFNDSDDHTINGQMFPSSVVYFRASIRNSQGGGAICRLINMADCDTTMEFRLPSGFTVFDFSRSVARMLGKPSGFMKIYKIDDRDIPDGFSFTHNDAPAGRVNEARLDGGKERRTSYRTFRPSVVYGEDIWLDELDDGMILTASLLDMESGDTRMGISSMFTRHGSSSTLTTRFKYPDGREIERRCCHSTEYGGDWMTRYGQKIGLIEQIITELPKFTEGTDVHSRTASCYADNVMLVDIDSIRCGNEVLRNEKLPDWVERYYEGFGEWYTSTCDTKQHGKPKGIDDSTLLDRCDELRGSLAANLRWTATQSPCRNGTKVTVNVWECGRGNRTVVFRTDSPMTFGEFRERMSEAGLSGCIESPFYARI